jgi:hypothetical protein
MYQTQDMTSESIAIVQVRDNPMKGDVRRAAKTVCQSSLAAPSSLSFRSVDGRRDGSLTVLSSMLKAGVIAAAAATRK